MVWSKGVDKLKKQGTMGLLTGCAFPQGGAIINGHFPCRKKPKALQCAHLLCCAANRIAQCMSIYASRFGFLRAMQLNIFEQPLNMGFFNSPTIPIYPKRRKL
jgi:hypothetical protein